MAESKIVAHYVVPTYNLGENVVQTHVITSDYYGKPVDINVWLVRATLGDETRSLISSFLNQRSLCELQQSFASNQIQRTMASRDIKYIDNIMMMLKQPSFECVADEKLKLVLGSYLDKLHAIYNLESAKLIAGIKR